MPEAFSVSLYRRSYDRYQVNDSATLIISNTERPSILKDLSLRGGGIVSDYPLSANEKVGVIIRSSLLDQPLHREAKVAWSNRIGGNLYRAGLDFGLDNRIEFK